MNVRLLRKVAKHIAAEPRRLDMIRWTDIVDPLLADNPPCGTVGCIAGWACMLSGMQPKKEATFHEFGVQGRKLLELNFEEADRLFTAPRLALDERRTYSWPKQFARRYVKAKSPKGRLAATLARIEHFIKTNGAE